MDFSTHFYKYLNEFNKGMNGFDVKTLSKLADTLLETIKSKNRIYVCGNGGSAANASHIVNDLSFVWGKDNERRFDITCLSDNISSILAIANDVHYDAIFVDQLIGIMKPKDVVVGLSGTGNSKNVVRALAYANANSGISVAVTAYDGGIMKEVAQISVHYPLMDMQKAEDSQILFFHCLMQYFRDE